MAAVEEREESYVQPSELVQPLSSCSGRQVFMGDLERRRPTKRMTTVRSFAVVRNWENQQSKRQTNEVSSSNVQSAQVLSRTDISPPRPKSPGLSHEPLGFDDVHPMSENDGDEIHIPPIPDDNVEEPQLTTSNENNIGAKPLSDVPYEASLELDDVQPMVVDDSPVRDEQAQHTSFDKSLPGGETSVSISILDNTLQKSSSKKLVKSNDQEDDEEDDDDDLGEVQENTPPKTESPLQIVGTKSGSHTKKALPATRKRVAFDRRTRDNQSHFDEEEYEAQNFVRLFNADRGRKGAATDVTDLDIVLTNIEEIALEIRSEMGSALGKKLVREAFIQIRQIFSDTIDIYKDKKYLQSATTKTNSKIKKTRQELLDIQDKRRETEMKLNKLKSECSLLKRQIKSKEEAYNFLSEFENFQDKLRKTYTGGQKECYCGESLPSLLYEASGYLSTQRQLRNINDTLQLWLNENNT